MTAARPSASLPSLSGSLCGSTDADTVKMAGGASLVWVWVDPAPPCPDLLCRQPPTSSSSSSSATSYQARICSLRTGLRIPCLFFLFSADSSNLECSTAMMVTVCGSRHARRRVYLETR
ncbi:hypothetical protein SORBI_3004G046001 [Sorghum bicolor]|uniref:Uncharacterized protein n=1 Tax=Sorghum bicolor TaxID=4558 RepID=A0A1Z5RKX8_SORBI|nr:hypothetical protein SORBI_3004G046001 [Sorghum bicolor]